MSKNKGIEYPHHIQTDQGDTIVKIVPGPAASKVHKCLFCEGETDFYETHILLLPRLFTGNRRYAHKDCYENYNEGMISLHPNAPNLMPSLEE